MVKWPSTIGDEKVTKNHLEFELSRSSYFWHSPSLDSGRVFGGPSPRHDTFSSRFHGVFPAIREGFQVGASNLGPLSSLPLGIQSLTFYWEWLVSWNLNTKSVLFRWWGTPQSSSSDVRWGVWIPDRVPYYNPPHPSYPLKYLRYLGSVFFRRPPMSNHSNEAPWRWAANLGGEVTLGGRRKKPSRENFGKPLAFIYIYIPEIHVWYIYLHLVDFYGECR